MSQYFSKVYRGFLIQQTDKGWVVPQLPNWSNGPVNQGPFSTYQIACHVLDRCLDNESSKSQSTSATVTSSAKKTETVQSTPIQESHNESSDSGSGSIFDVEIWSYIFVIALFFALADFFHFSQHPIRFFVDCAVLVWAVRGLAGK